MCYFRAVKEQTVHVTVKKLLLHGVLCQDGHVTLFEDVIPTVTAIFTGCNITNNITITVNKPTALIRFTAAVFAFPWFLEVTVKSVFNPSYAKGRFLIVLLIILRENTDDRPIMSGNDNLISGGGGGGKEL